MSFYSDTAVACQGNPLKRQFVNQKESESVLVWFWYHSPNAKKIGAATASIRQVSANLSRETHVRSYGSRVSLPSLSVIVLFGCGI